MFTVMQAVLLNPLPLEDQDSVVVLSMHERRDLSSHLDMRYADLHALRERSSAFVGIASVPVRGASPMLLRDGNRALLVQGALVSGNLFDVLRVSPVAGRMLTAEDDSPGAPDVMVITESMWHRDFGGDPAVVGRSITNFGLPYVLVGVVPDGLDFPRQTEVWATANAMAGGMEPANPNSGALDFVARLRRGATASQGQADLQQVVQNVPRANVSNRVIVVRPLLEAVIGDMRSRVWVLSAAVGLVFLLACGNVAMLTLARGGGRAHEVAVRVALGARPKDLAMQLVAEGAILAGLAGVAGAFAASGLLKAIVALSPADLPRLGEVALDSESLMFAMAAGGAAVVLGTLGPAVSAIRLRPMKALGSESPNIGPGRGRNAGRQAIVAAQVALALVVLVGANLLVSSLARLQTQDLGLEDDQLIVAMLIPGELEGLTGAEYVSMFGVLRDGLLGIPGVQGVTSMGSPPFSAGGALYRPLALEESREETDIDQPFVAVQPVADGFFEVLGIPLLRGRALLETDAADAPRVALANETLSRLLASRGEAINQSVRLGTNLQESWNIVGVVADVRYYEFGKRRQPRSTCQGVSSMRKDSRHSLEFGLGFPQAECSPRFAVPLRRVGLSGLDGFAPDRISWPPSSLDRGSSRSCFPRLRSPG